MGWEGANNVEEFYFYKMANIFNLVDADKIKAKYVVFVHYVNMHLFSRAEGDIPLV